MTGLCSGICNGFNGATSKESGFVNYESIKRGFQDIFEKLASENIEFEIHMPRIGCGLVDGNWEVMESIIVEEFFAKISKYMFTIYKLSRKMLWTGKE